MNEELEESWDGAYENLRDVQVSDGAIVIGSHFFIRSREKKTVSALKTAYFRMVLPWLVTKTFRR